MKTDSPDSAPSSSNGFSSEPGARLVVLDQETLEEGPHGNRTRILLSAQRQKKILGPSVWRHEEKERRRTRDWMRKERKLQFDADQVPSVHRVPMKLRPQQHQALRLGCPMDIYVLENQ